jgi:hypothetical protein
LYFQLYHGTTQSLGGIFSVKIEELDIEFSFLQKMITIDSVYVQIFGEEKKKRRNEPATHPPEQARTRTQHTSPHISKESAGKNGRR